MLKKTNLPSGETLLNIHRICNLCKKILSFPKKQARSSAGRCNPIPEDCHQRGQCILIYVVFTPSPPQPPWQCLTPIPVISLLLTNTVSRVLPIHMIGGVLWEPKNKTSVVLSVFNSSISATVSANTVKRTLYYTLECSTYLILYCFQ